MEVPGDHQALLIDGARRGDPEAFEGLVDLYADRLYGYFYRLTRSAAEAEDLLQDLFVRLVGAMSRYDHYDHFEAFLFRIAANLFRDRIRRRRRSKETVSLSGGDADQGDTLLSQGPAATGVAPDAELERAERSVALQEALSRLPDGEREVVVLRHFSGLSFKEIADIMGTPVGTALARAHRGLSHLRALIEGADHG